MTGYERAVLDTSVFIASEAGRPISVDGLPEQSAISPVTVAELRAGVLAADDVLVRARRMKTLEAVLDIKILPIDAAVAESWALLRVHLLDAGRRCNVNDLWIASTALAHGVPVVTQDRDFEAVDGAFGLVVAYV